jgi:nucleotide-binding universal stress UspA family protein
VVRVHTAYIEVESGLIYDDRVDRYIRDEEQNYLRNLSKRLDAVAHVPVKVGMRDGPIVDGIRAQVTATRADLIVMTTHGRGPMSRFWLGSVADDLVQHAGVPVLLVRPQDSTPDFTQEPVLRHVVIPLDGSPLAEHVLGPAVTLGKLLETDFTLLRVVRPVLFAGHDPTLMGTPVFGQPATGQLQAEAHTYLEGVADRLRAQSLRVQTKVLVDMHPPMAILKGALEQPGSVIALATHGRGGLTRVLLGSVADKLIRSATMPVLVCPPSGNNP